MGHSLATLLFFLAVLLNLTLVVAGMTATFVVSLRRGRRAALERRAAAAREISSFHHPDPVVTPLPEKLFMLAATALVFVGLPVALAAIFRFALPLLGQGFTP